MYSPYTSKALTRGKLTRERQYTDAGSIVKERKITYRALSNRSLRQVLVENVVGCDGRSIFGNTSQLRHYAVYGTAYKVYTYPFYRYDEQVIDYYGSQAVRTDRQYRYDNINHQQLSRFIIKDSEGQTRTTTYQYAQDFSGSNYGSQNLRAAHMHSVIVTQTDKIGSTTTSKIHNFYGKLSSGPVVKYRTDDYPNGGSTSIRTIYSYDDKGNLVQVEKSGDRPISYLWGYSGTLPVVQVKGLSYGDLKKILDNDSYIKGLYYRPPASVSDKNYYITGRLNKLRGKLPNHALMTGYAYEPLFGVTREMAPDGTQMRYEYDGLGRISVIRDQDNYILQRYLYNYR